MLSSKFFFTVVALLAVILAICKLDFGGGVQEGFWMTGNRGWKTFPVVRDPKTGRETAISGNFLNPNLGNQQFVSVPKFQSILSPRFSNLDYGAYIRYNTPDYKNMAAPCNPLTFGDMAKEGYTGHQQSVADRPQNYIQEGYQTSGCGTSSCGRGCAPSCLKGGLPKDVPMPSGYELPPSYADGNYNNELNKIYMDSAYPDATDELPVGTMTGVDMDGNVVQPVVYDRFMFARPQGRLRHLGDPIRGDLAIVPCQSGWFSVYPNINIDLQEGAMNVMGGVHNETNNSLAALINKASGGGDFTIGGVDLQNINLSTQNNIDLSRALGDVTVSAYP